MKLIETICFPTDFGKSAEVALNGVIDIAHRFGSEVKLVHVLPDSLNLEVVKSKVEEKLKGYADILQAKGIECTTHLLQGDHVAMLLPFAERKKANLIILGAGHVGKEHFKLGSNSEKIIRESSIPVWVMEKEKTTVPQKVLCPFDFSDESMLALENAVHLCRRYEAELHIIHIVQKIEREYVEWGFDLAEEEAKMVKEYEDELKEATNDMDFSGVKLNMEVCLGQPTDVILDMIKEKNIDLLMMGSTGKGALKRLLIGSVAERVSRQVPCSFIINKSEGMIHLKIERDFSDIESIYNEGIQLANQGFLQEAIIEWRRCIHQNVLYFKAWSAIVKAHESLGDTENAKKTNDGRDRVQRILWDQQIEADLKGRNYLFS